MHNYRRMKTEDSLKHFEFNRVLVTQEKTSNLSHELIGFEDMLEDSTMLPIQKEHAKNIIDASLQLQRLLNEQLVSREMKFCEISIENKSFLISTLVKRVYDRIYKAAINRGLSVFIYVDPDLPALFGDERLLGQALDILGSNALRLTKQGSVTISVQLLNNQNGYVQLGFEVKDTGTGMPMYRQNELLAFLATVDVTKISKDNTINLDLFICAHLVKLLQGELEFESKFGKGSQFLIKLWLKRV